MKIGVKDIATFRHRKRQERRLMDRVALSEQQHKQKDASNSDIDEDDTPCEKDSFRTDASTDIAEDSPSDE